MFIKSLSFSRCALTLFTDYMTMFIALFKGSMMRQNPDMYRKVNGHYMWYRLLQKMKSDPSHSSFSSSSYGGFFLITHSSRNSFSVENTTGPFSVIILGQSKQDLLILFSIGTESNISQKEAFVVRKR